MQKSTINGQLQPIVSLPWWVSSGSQDEHVNHFGWGEEHQKNGNFLKSQLIMGQAAEKEKDSVFQVAFSQGQNKNSFKDNTMHNHETNSFQHLVPSQQKGYFELGLGQPMVYANYPAGDQGHGLFAAYGTHTMGRVMLPFSVTTEDGPIYVNPKQYRGILRRRKMREKEGLKTKSTKDKQPYLHESRHRHACRRPRGAGGRFLNTKTLDSIHHEQESNNKTSDHQTHLSSQSSGSEVLQSESVNLNNSSKEASDSKSSNLSGSEVTSMYYSKEFDCFRLNPARPFAFRPLPNIEGTGPGGGGDGGGGWVAAAADGCCNFFKV